MKKPDKFTIAFLLLLSVFLIFNLSVMDNYGMTWDEAAQQHIGKAASDYVRGNSGKMEFLREDLVYYGPFFEIMNQDFGTSMLESFRMNYVSAFHVLIIIAAAAGLFFFFRLVSMMFDGQTALLSSAFLALWPIFAAHSQYNTKDIPLFAGFTAALYFLYAGFRKRIFWKLFVAGAIFGLALSVRIDALLLIPVFFLPYAGYLFFGLRKESEKEFPKRFGTDFLYAFVFIATGALFAYFSWPTLWKNPFFFFQALGYFLHHGWPGQVLYFGKIYTGSNLPWHYVPFYFLISISVLILILAAFGTIIAIRKMRGREKMLEYSLILAWLFLRLAAGIFPGSVKYDGIRHFIVIAPAIMVLAALGFGKFLEIVPEYFPKSDSLKIKAWLIAALFLWLVIDFFWIFPFGGSYINEPARTFIPKPIEKRFDFEYWGASYRQGVDWLNKNAQLNTGFCVPIAGHLLQFYPIRPDLKFDCSENTDYLIFITRWAYLPSNLEENFHFSNKSPAFTVSRYGSDLLEIYKLK
ncbi:MAG: glycosyltransferase family 39 protein [Parcubacteria group bacterium]|jgi:hypothetical protein